jgi:D-arabinonate dehydratase
MKITGCKTYALSIPMVTPKAIATRPIKSREFGMVELSTDEGIEGVGYTFNPLAPAIVASLQPLFVGKDPFMVEEIWDILYRNSGVSYQKGVSIRAISMIDMAIWDILGKYLNQPLYKLLGAYREKVPCYTSAGYYRFPIESQSVNELVEEMNGLVKKGAKRLKMRIGGMSIEDDIRRVAAVKKSLNDGVELMVDANNAYNVIQATRMGRLLEELGIYWFEEPLSPDDYWGYEQLAKTLSIPIALGEQEYTRFGFRELIQRKVVGVVQPDASVCGGVTEWRRIAALAGSFKVPVAPHVVGDGGVNLHMAATTPDLLFMEYFEPESEISKIELLFNEYSRAEGGYVSVPKKPGLGLTLNRGAVERYKIR